MSPDLPFCKITNSGVVSGRYEIQSFSGTDRTENLISLYKELRVDYPKFYKMDLLSKAAFLGVEMLKRQCPKISENAGENVALLFANSEASSDTDIKFEESYKKDGLPSPSLFVYTLPNIAMGEVAIRNKWHGSQMFVVFPNFAPASYVEHAKMILDEQVTYLICGWVNVREKLDAFLFVLDRETLKDTNLVERIRNLYEN